MARGQVWGQDRQFQDPNVWVPHASDLSHLEHFLRGYFKDCAHDNDPKSFELLKTNVKGHICSIDNDMCNTVVDNFKRRILPCFD